MCRLLRLEAVTAPAADVTDAAKVGLKHFLDLIPAGSRQQYGFSETGLLDKAYLGDPFNLHIITPDALFSYSEGVPVASILTPIDQWYFPVMMGNQIRCFLVVDRMDGRWEAVSLGYVTLAQVYESDQAELACGEGVQSGANSGFAGKEVSGVDPRGG